MKLLYLLRPLPSCCSTLVFFFSNYPVPMQYPVRNQDLPFSSSHSSAIPTSIPFSVSEIHTYFRQNMRSPRISAINRKTPKIIETMTPPDRAPVSAERKREAISFKRSISICLEYTNQLLPANGIRHVTATCLADSRATRWESYHIIHVHRAPSGGHLIDSYLQSWSSS